MKKLIMQLFIAAVMMTSCTRNEPQLPVAIKQVLSRENLPSTFFSISADKDTILTGKSGTQIHISKNTFVDSYGNAAHGVVNVELKEAITCADIVLGNMTTLSNGEVLQSGGMIYLNATSENKNLAIAKKSSIEVSVPTEEKNDSMMIYSAEVDSQTNQLNWVKPMDLMVRINNSDTSSIVQSEYSEIKTVRDTIVYSRAETENIPEPKKPKQFQGGDTTISLIFDTMSFPELAQYRNVKFKLLDNSNFTPSDSKMEWISIDLKKTNEEGVYLITFAGYHKNTPIQKTYKVSPVFEAGSDYNTAMAEYNLKYEQFEKKKSEIEQKRVGEERQQKLALDEAEKQQKLAMEKWEKEKTQREADIKVQIEANKELLANSTTNAFSTDKRTVYVFNLKRLGWANIDVLYRNRNTKDVNLVTVVENHKDFDNLYVSMIFKKQKIYLPGYQKRDQTFGFSHSDYEQMRLPVGEDAIIIATAYKDGQSYFAMNKITISTEQTVSIQLQETSVKEIQSELKHKL